MGNRFCINSRTTTVLRVVASLTQRRNERGGFSAENRRQPFQAKVISTRERLFLTQMVSAAPRSVREVVVLFFSAASSKRDAGGVTWRKYSGFILNCHGALARGHQAAHKSALAKTRVTSNSMEILKQVQDDVLFVVQFTPKTR